MSKNNSSVNSRRGDAQIVLGFLGILHLVFVTFSFSGFVQGPGLDKRLERMERKERLNRAVTTISVATITEAAR